MPPLFFFTRTTVKSPSASEAEVEIAEASLPEDDSELVKDSIESVETELTTIKDARRGLAAGALHLFLTDFWVDARK